MKTSEITNGEILAISLKIEGAGKVFYTELAKFVTDPKVKDFVLLMANEEAKHEKQFKKLLADKGAKTYGWERQKSLRQMVDIQFQTDIFPSSVADIFSQLPEFKGIQKALEFAANAEKTSKEFYEILGQFCEDFDAKTSLLLLEKAEQEHLERINTLRKQFSKE